MSRQRYRQNLCDHGRVVDRRGIALDDTFVILAVWWRTEGTDVEDRLRQTFDHCASSITITSATNIVCFFSGCFTPCFSMSIFSIYATLGFLVLYIFQITFILGAFVLMARREVDGLHFFTGNPVDKGETEIIVHDSSIRSNSCNKFFFGDLLAGCISYPLMKYFIYLLYGAYISAAIFGVSQISHNLRLFNLLRDDSYAASFLRQGFKYFHKYDFAIQVAFLEELDYSDPDTNNQINIILSQLESLPYIDSQYTMFWMKEYNKALNHPLVKMIAPNKNFSNKYEYNSFLKDFLLKESLLRVFKSDIIFGDNSTDIHRSRFYIQAVSIDETDEREHLITSVRTIIDSSPFKMAMFSSMSVYVDHYQMLVRSTTISIIFSAVMAILILFLFIPKFQIIMWVGISIVSIILGVIGYMHFLGIELDNISMLGLIIGVGYSVDSCVHITYAFLCSEEDDIAERLKDSMESVGLAIVYGSLSTVLDEDISNGRHHSMNLSSVAITASVRCRNRLQAVMRWDFEMFAIALLSSFAAPNSLRTLKTNDRATFKNSAISDSVCPSMYNEIYAIALIDI
ncbi:daf-6 [Cordylochernes scorpioides]|uniref:Daf-6 n=1 Tax=Cordylochernes scorpioides TaxID=51811 RepID=A0ABY6KEQ3_9ARAC|nr:daf-6 [Cordylochernes scorpioides]